MSFEVFASGTGKFHYENKSFIDGSHFEMMKVINILQNMEPSAFGVVGAVQDHVTPGITDLMEALATREFLHNLKNAVDFLAMCSGSSSGWISVVSTEKNTFWTDTVRLNKYKFSPGDDPGTEFVKTIGKSLKETSLDNWGVLLALSLVLSKYSNTLSDSATPMIQIWLTK